MASSLLSIGIGALNTAQAGLTTASHNISNAATPGYNRQEILQATNNPYVTGSGIFGQGVHVTTVKRIYSDFLAHQVTEAQSGISAAETQYQQLSQLDNLLADSAAGLSPALQTFFSGVNDLANHPADLSARQSMLSSGEALVGRLQQLQARFDEVRSGVQVLAESSVATINSAANEIARLNDAIAQSETRLGAHTANDLRDQRDQLINQLNTQIKATVVQQDDGAINVFVGNGQPLVMGNRPSTVLLRPSAANPEQFEVAFQNGSTTLTVPSASLTGGALGGVLSFQTRALDPAQNALGRIALGLAASFNAQHRLGVDSNGALGGDFFSIDLPEAIARAGNSGNGIIQASVSNAALLQASDYQIDYDGSQYTLTRLSDGNSQTTASLPASVDGLTLSLASGSVAAGDRFLLRPTANGAGAVGIAITSTTQLAAAAPIRTQAALSNIGSATLSAGSVDAAYSATPLVTPITLSYNAATGQLSGFPATASVTVSNGGASTTYAPGASVPYTSGATISVNGMHFSLSGAPANGDQFTIRPNTGAVGDNRNAMALAALQTANILGNGSASFQSAYSQLVSQVGNQTREAEVSKLTQGKMLEQATSAQQSMSGVNLDEEAANLLRYQQAYQAAGKVMQIASELFNTLLNLGGR